MTCVVRSRPWNDKANSARMVTVPTLRYTTLVEKYHLAGCVSSVRSRLPALTAEGALVGGGCRMRVPFFKIDCEGCEYSVIPSFTDESWDLIQARPKPLLVLVLVLLLVLVLVLLRLFLLLFLLLVLLLVLAMMLMMLMMLVVAQEAHGEMHAHAMGANKPSKAVVDVTHTRYCHKLAAPPAWCQAEGWL